MIRANEKGQMKMMMMKKTMDGSFEKTSLG